jgi:hypothetical protein
MVMRIIPELYDQLPENPVEMLLISFGAQDEIAAFCSVTPQAVWNWKNRGSIPYVYIEDLSKKTGIPTWMLCPKHFKKGESDGVFRSVDEGNGQD